MFNNVVFMICKKDCIPCDIAKKKLKEKGYSIIAFEIGEMSLEQKRKLVGLRKDLKIEELSFPVIIGSDASVGYNPAEWRDLNGKE